MNNLKFIDREISSTEIDLWYSKRLLNENPPKEELKKEMLEVKINVLEKRMKYLQQIKTELEAWEVVKKEIKSTYNKNNYMTIAFTYCDFIENEKYDKLKKALEVKDEKETK